MTRARCGSECTAAHEAEVGVRVLRILPLLRVADLRKRGITLHLALDSEREAITDVPAIYFCRPTEENLRRIAKDMEDGLYGSYYFNFISPINVKSAFLYIRSISIYSRGRVPNHLYRYDFTQYHHS